MGDNMDEQILKDDLEDLRQCLLNYKPEREIAFIDKTSYYLYLDNIKHNGKSVKNILDNIYTAIPLLLTDNAYTCFKQSMEDLDIDKFENVSKADFFDFAYKNINNWQYITRLCLSINKYLD